MTRNFKKNAMTILVALVGLVILGSSTGCDEYSLLNGLGYGWSGYSYPSFSPYYDATSTIQSVNDYRQDVMDWSNDSWDAYIRG